MSGKVFFSVTMSLDGFIAPGSLGDLMGQQWMELQQWVLPLRFFRANLKLRERVRDVREDRRERDRQAHVRRRRADVAGGGPLPPAGLRRDAREACPLG